MKRYLLIIENDVSARLCGPVKSDVVRLAVAKNIKKARGDKDGLFRLNILSNGRPIVGDFGAMEFDEEEGKG